MILDNRSLFSDKQAITATANSTDCYDLGAPGKTGLGVQLKRALGKGAVIPLLVLVTESFNNLTSLDIVMQEASDSAFTSPKELFRVKVLLADLVKGYKLPIDKLPANIDLEFIRMRYEVTGTAPTTGKITAGIVASVGYPYVG